MAAAWQLAAAHRASCGEEVNPNANSAGQAAELEAVRQQQNPTGTMGSWEPNGMMPQVIFEIVALLVLLAIIGFILYRRSVEVRFSVNKVVTFFFRGSNPEFPSETREALPQREASLPMLVLRLIDTHGTHQKQSTLLQTFAKQEFLFGLALINMAEGSPPAQGLDVRIQSSWSGSDPQVAPTIRPDRYRRTTPGWTAPRLSIQQGPDPHPAILAFHGSTDYRCAYGHPLEWHRFSISLGEKMSGRFILDYGISCTIPRVEAKGEAFIIIVPSSLAAA